MCWPQEYSDGLIENTPAVINETDYFSLSIFGDKYAKNWNGIYRSTQIPQLLSLQLLWQKILIFH